MFDNFGYSIIVFFFITVGLGAFIYHERYVNKPHTLDDGFSDSGGCSTSVDDSIGRVSHIDCSGLDIPTVSYFHLSIQFLARLYILIVKNYCLYFIRKINF